MCCVAAPPWQAGNASASHGGMPANCARAVGRDVVLSKAWRPCKGAALDDGCQACGIHTHENPFSAQGGRATARALISLGGGGMLARMSCTGSRVVVSPFPPLASWRMLGAHCVDEPRGGTSCRCDFATCGSERIARITSSVCATHSPVGRRLTRAGGPLHGEDGLFEYPWPCACSAMCEACPGGQLGGSRLGHPPAALSDMVVSTRP